MTSEARPATDLSRRRVLVAGGTGAVGEGIVRAYLASGAEVVVPSRTDGKANDFQNLLADADTSRLHTLVADYNTFTGAEEMAQRIERDFGPVDDVVASIGGWWAGKAIWQISESDWNDVFVAWNTAHVAMIRAFLPRMNPAGAYTLILGGSAHTPVPGSGIVSMEQAGLMMMRNVLEAEAGDQRRIFSLVLGPVLNRNRPGGAPDWVSADEVGEVAVAASAADCPGAEIRMNSKADVQRALAGLGPVQPASAGASAVPASMPEGWPELGPGLAGCAVQPRDRDYDRLRSSYMKAGTPRVIFSPTTEAQVAEAIRYAAAARAARGEAVEFSVRSGGHGIGGHSTNNGGILLDMGKLKAIEVLNASEGLVKVQAGARWGAVAQALAPFDLVISSGNFGDTGVGGLATAGGVGYFARAHGLTVDHVVGARVITADGTIHVVDAAREPELFWGIRGGATQLGVVTEFVFQAQRIEGTKVINHEVNQLVDNLPEFTERWGAFLEDAPRELTSFTMVQPTGDGRYVVNSRNVWANQDVSAAQEILQGYLGLAPVMDQNASIANYADVVPSPGWPHSGQQQLHMRNALVNRADRALGEALHRSLGHDHALVAELRSLGGAVSDVRAGQTAWAHRDQKAFVSMWASPVEDAELDRSWEPIARLSTGMYGAYTAETTREAAELAWPGETGARLAELAGRVDPRGLFGKGLVLRR